MIYTYVGSRYRIRYVRSRRARSCMDVWMDVWMDGWIGLMLSLIECSWNR